MNKTTKPATENQTIETIQTVELDNVTGGCAACGMANCTMGASPAASPAARAPLFSSWFNRR